MCGIAGIVGRPPDDPGLIERMTAMLRHRGPDDRGVWRSERAHLGHARLSILDLSAAGRQPMELGDRVLTYNGEIYNFRDLRRRYGGSYRSESDSEVVLHGFRRRGEECVRDFHGMFAFAIWDEAEGRLFAARDHLGIKPFHYRPLDGALAFASEVEPLLELGRPEIDAGALADYLAWGYVPTPKTPWRGIFKLGAAETLTWQDGEIEIRRYWDPEGGEPVTGRDRAVAELDEILREVVREHTVSDVPVGVFLSGGLDSATLTSYLEGASTFTLGQFPPRRDESPAARRVAEIFRTEHHEETAEIPDLWEAAETMARTFGEPFADSAALSVWLLSRMTRRHVKVALSGEGGDEIFCGYRWYGNDMRRPPPPLARIVSRLVPRFTTLGRSLRRRAARGIDRYAAFVHIFPTWQVEELLGERLRDAAPEDPLWPLRPYWRPELGLEERVQWADLHTYLPDQLLAKVDRASMAHSLEVRPPFLDRRLVEWAFACDAALKRDRETDRGKIVLRRLMEDRLPPGHLDLPKRGFNLSIHRWSRRNPEVLRNALSRLRQHGILHRRTLFSLTNDQIWSLLVLDRWLARHDASHPDGPAGA